MGLSKLGILAHRQDGIAGESRHRLMKRLDGPAWNGKYTKMVTKRVGVQ